MRKIEITAYELAQRFAGIKEVPGAGDSHQVMTFLTLDDSWPGHDEVPWCSAFVNYVCWLLRLPRSKSLAARSWLSVGYATPRPEVGFDVVVLKRGGEGQPGPEVINAPGHVGFFAGYQEDRILVLAGNQNNEVNITGFPQTQVLGIRRLWE